MSGEPTTKKVKRFSGSVRKEEFDEETQHALEEIDVCQNEIDKLNDEASEEILIIEKKYNQLRKPYYERRDQIIGNIPNFWVVAIMNHPDLAHMVDDTEENCLHYLTKLEVEEFEDVKSGYCIKFHFEENPYFENAVLIKGYHFDPSNPRCTSTQVLWKDRSNLGESSTTNNQDVGKNQRRRKYEQNKSFFDWLSKNNDPYVDDIAEVFKDDLWLNPLQYYLVPDAENEEQHNLEGDELSSSDDGEQASTSREDNGGGFTSQSVDTRTN